MKLLKDSFFKDGLSIDESKISTLIITFIVCIIFTLIFYWLNGDISNNLLQLLITLIYAISGINITKKVSDIFTKNKDDNETNEGI